jgi:hypothetical protein
MRAIIYRILVSALTEHKKRSLIIAILNQPDTIRLIKQGVKRTTIEEGQELGMISMAVVARNLYWVAANKVEMDVDNATEMGLEDHEVAAQFRERMRETAEWESYERIRNKLELAICRRKGFVGGWRHTSRYHGKDPTGESVWEGQTDTMRFQIMCYNSTAHTIVFNSLAEVSSQLLHMLPQTMRDLGVKIPDQRISNPDPCGNMGTPLMLHPQSDSFLFHTKGTVNTVVREITSVTKASFDVPDIFIENRTILIKFGNLCVYKAKFTPNDGRCSLPNKITCSRTMSVFQSTKRATSCCGTGSMTSAFTGRST